MIGFGLWYRIGSIRFVKFFPFIFYLCLRNPVLTFFAFISLGLWFCPVTALWLSYCATLCAPLFNAPFLPPPFGIKGGPNRTESDLPTLVTLHILILFAVHVVHTSSICKLNDRHKTIRFTFLNIYEASENRTKGSPMSRRKWWKMAKNDQKFNFQANGGKMGL